VGRKRVLRERKGTRKVREKEGANKKKTKTTSVVRTGAKEALDLSYPSILRSGPPDEK